MDLTLVGLLENVLGQINQLAKREVCQEVQTPVPRVSRFNVFFRRLGLPYR